MYTYGICPHCGIYHTSFCPKVKSIEYWPNGQIKKIEYWEEHSNNTSKKCLPNYWWYTE